MIIDIIYYSIILAIILYGLSILSKLSSMETKNNDIIEDELDEIDNMLKTYYKFTVIAIVLAMVILIIKMTMI